MDKRKNKALMIFLDTKDMVNLLSDEDAGKVLKSLLNYFTDGTEPTGLSDVARMVYLSLFNTAKRRVDDYEEANNKRSETQKENWRRRNESTDNEQ